MKVTALLLSTLATLSIELAHARAVLPKETVILRSSSAIHTDGRSCLSGAYYGSYGGRHDATDHIYLAESGCISEYIDDGTDEEMSISTFLGRQRGARLVWVGQAVVEGVETSNLETMMDYGELIMERARSRVGPRPEWGMKMVQQALPDTPNTLQGIELPTIIQATSHSLLLHVPFGFLPLIDELLPEHLVPVVLSAEPLPPPRAPTGNEWGVLDEFSANLANLTAHLNFDPEMDRILSSISYNDLRRDIRWLTGEAPSGFESRHSFTQSSINAAHWIKDQMTGLGASCELVDFLPGFSPNVICKYAALEDSQDHIILSAHYDSRGSFGFTRGPGANDDGSGTGHLLAIARTIAKMEVKFVKPVTIAFFSGEEQGLNGSNDYAHYLQKLGQNVTLQVQADMLGYHVPGEPMQLSFPDRIQLNEASWLLGNLSHMYSPELLVGQTNSCCSDHQSFLALGFPATAVGERNGPIADPQYHHSEDLSQREGYDFDQIISIAKVTLAGIMTVAGWKIDRF